MLERDIEVPLAILDLSRQHRLSDLEQGRGPLRGHDEVYSDPKPRVYVGRNAGDDAENNSRGDKIVVLDDGGVRRLIYYYILNPRLQAF